MLLPVLVSHVVLLRAAWAVSPISKSFGKGNGFWHALATHSCELEYSSSQWPAHKISARHNDILGLFCDQAITWSPGTILGRFEYRLGIVLGIVLCAPKVACSGLPKLG